MSTRMIMYTMRSKPTKMNTFSLEDVDVVEHVGVFLCSSRRSWRAAPPCPEAAARCGKQRPPVLTRPPGPRPWARGALTRTWARGGADPRRISPTRAMGRRLLPPPKARGGRIALPWAPRRGRSGERHAQLHGGSLGPESKCLRLLDIFRKLARSRAASKSAGGRRFVKKSPL